MRRPHRELARLALPRHCGLPAAAQRAAWHAAVRLVVSRGLSQIPPCSFRCTPVLIGDRNFQAARGHADGVVGPHGRGEARTAPACWRCVASRIVLRLTQPPLVSMCQQDLPHRRAGQPPLGHGTSADAARCTEDLAAAHFVPPQRAATPCRHRVGSINLGLNRRQCRPTSPRHRQRVAWNRQNFGPARQMLAGSWPSDATH